MSQKKVYLRAVIPDDIHLLFEWANDRIVRENAFHKEPISFREHKSWFEKLLKDDKQVQYILMHGNDAAGQVRLTIDGGCAEIHYSIAPQKRNMGLGKELIRLIQDKVYDDLPNISKLIGKVKTENVASRQCFEENGFSEMFIQYELEMENMELSRKTD